MALVEVLPTYLLAEGKVVVEAPLLDDTDRARALRPEKIRLVAEPGARLAGIVETANFLGGATLYRVRTDAGRTFLAREAHAGARSARQPGDRVGLAWDDSDMVVLES